MTTPPRRFRDFARVLGPGLVVAATGVGAGDLVAASKAGAAYGLPILWVAVVGAVLKFALAEGIARWQLATGTTVLEGWAHTFPRPVRIVFLVYLVLWTFIVGAALMSACGLAGHALVPGLSVRTWAVLHSLVGLGFVWFEGYRVFETVMKVAVAVMVVAIVGAAALEAPPLGETVRGLIVPDVPSGSLLLLLGVVGGVGGSVTLLSYNYWLAEKRWAGRSWLAAARVDLGVGYVLTGVFGVAMIILAGMILLPRGLDVAGSRGLLDLAAVLGERFGRVGELVFLIGFWGAVASSLLGVWQSVPYLFADAWGLERTGEAAPETSPPLTRTRPYRGYLLYLALAPMLLLLIDRPVWLVVVYAAVGSLFMPFLAGTLLVMNNRRPILGSLRNGPVANVTLGLCLALFAYLGVREILEQIGG